MQLNKRYGWMSGKMGTGKVRLIISYGQVHNTTVKLNKSVYNFYEGFGNFNDMYSYVEAECYGKILSFTRVKYAL